MAADHHDAFRFWRHLSARTTPIIVPIQQVQPVEVRRLAKREWFLVNPGCRVLVCDGPTGRLEVALLHRGELDILAWHLGAHESLPDP